MITAFLLQTFNLHQRMFSTKSVTNPTVYYDKLDLMCVYLDMSEIGQIREVLFPFCQLQN